MNRRSFIAVAITSAAGLAAASCARVPAGSGDSAVLLRVRAVYRGEVTNSLSLRQNSYFFLIHRTDSLNDPGPVPVVQAPWGGNGFASASQPGAQGFVGFVQYDAGGFGVYSLQSGGTLLPPEARVFEYLGTPETSVTPRPGERELLFQLDLSRLPLADKRYVYINIISTDTIPQTPDDQVKLWDSIEDGTRPQSLTPWVVLDTSINDRKSNQADAREPAFNDVRDRINGPPVDEPTLDLVDWQVDIQRG